MSVLFPILIKVSKQKEKVLSLFLDIPEKQVKILYNKCENFISNLQVEDDDELQSDIEVSFEKEDDKSSYKRPRKRKKFKNSGKSHRKLLVKLSFGALIISFYFFGNFLLSTNHLKHYGILIKEIATTSKAEGYYGFVYNVER
jgi:hypothetical protein